MRMGNTIPQISVMLCAYNAERYIGEAIDSVLAQTYTDFELLIIDDGSTDRTIQIVEKYKDPRIKIIRGKHDYIKSLNKGMSKCQGEYIARIDADDRMLPNRLERQLSLMEEKPDIAACFSWAEKFGGASGIHGIEAKGYIRNVLFWLLPGNFLIHPSVMLRKSFIKQYHLRYKNYPYAEDYKLWTDIARIGDHIYVIPEPLVQYRISKSQVSYKYNEEQRLSKLSIQQEILEQLLVRINHPQKEHLRRLYNIMLKLNNADLVEPKELIVFMYKLLRRTDSFD